MYSVSQTRFDELIDRSISALPKRHIEHLENVAFIVEDEPSPKQRQDLNLKHYQTLFGLYEGVPLNQRLGRTKLLPDKITIFKLPIEHASNNEEELRSHIARTIWHEIAHYYGLNHTKIYDLESRENT